MKKRDKRFDHLVVELKKGNLDPLELCEFAPYLSRKEQEHFITVGLRILEGEVFTKEEFFLMAEKGSEAVPVKKTAVSCAQTGVCA